MAKKRRKVEPDPFICQCNEVRKSVIVQALENGAQTLNEIFDHTSAGVGACGGSCRRQLKPMLDDFLTEHRPQTPLPAVEEVSQLPHVEKKKSS